MEPFVDFGLLEIAAVTGALALWRRVRRLVRDRRGTFAAVTRSTSPRRSRKTTSIPKEEALETPVSEP
jgi:hypothetical protein